MIGIMQLKILNPYKNQPNQANNAGWEVTTYYDTFHRNEILFNYIVNKLYQLKDNPLPKSVSLITQIHIRSGIEESELYQAGVNHLIHMKNIWGLDDKKASMVRSIWENVCRCESDGKWTVPYIKTVGKHKFLKKVLSKNG